MACSCLQASLDQPHLPEAHSYLRLSPLLTYGVLEIDQVCPDDRTPALSMANTRRI